MDLSEDCMKLLSQLQSTSDRLNEGFVTSNDLNESPQSNVHVSESTVLESNDLKDKREFVNDDLVTESKSVEQYEPFQAIETSQAEQQYQAEQQHQTEQQHQAEEQQHQAEEQQHQTEQQLQVEQQHQDQHEQLKIITDDLKENIPHNEKEPILTSKGYRLDSRLFIGNLTDRITKNDLENIFAKYGKILDIHLGRSFGLVQFSNPEEMNAALSSEKGNLVLDGIRAALKVNSAVRDPTSSRPNSANRKRSRSPVKSPAMRPQRNRRNSRERSTRRNVSPDRNRPRSPIPRSPQTGSEVHILMYKSVYPNFQDRLERIIINAGFHVTGSLINPLSGKELNAEIGRKQRMGVYAVIVVKPAEANKQEVTMMEIYDRSGSPSYFSSVKLEDIAELLLKSKSQQPMENQPDFSGSNQSLITPQNSIIIQLLLQQLDKNQLLHLITALLANPILLSQCTPSGLGGLLANLLTTMGQVSPSFNQPMTSASTGSNQYGLQPQFQQAGMMNPQSFQANMQQNWDSTSVQPSTYNSAKYHQY